MILKTKIELLKQHRRLKTKQEMEETIDETRNRNMLTDFLSFVI